MLAEEYALDYGAFLDCSCLEAGVTRSPALHKHVNVTGNCSPTLMNIRIIQGVIDRRILINYTVHPEVVRKIVPYRFRPKIYHGKAIAGICLIRIKHIRPQGLPQFLGVSSENGAHRIAVEWDENGECREGVFVPRRDSSSWFNSIAGGRLFPGKHYHGKFTVVEGEGSYNITLDSSDGTTLAIEAEQAKMLNENSIFQNLRDASSFFEKGSVGYSPNGKSYDGLELKTLNWKVEPLSVNLVQSSFFENTRIFPTGSVVFDSALLMTKIEHEWHSVGHKSNRL